MDAIIWILLPGFTAVGSGLLVWFIMQSRMEVAVAKEREALAEARGALAAQRRAMEDSVKGAEETGRRKALDEFLSEVRIEQRHYVRENKLLFLTRRSLVLEERIFFRNLPLSNWIEHEIMIQEGADLEKLAQAMSVFDGAGALAGGPRALLK